MTGALDPLLGNRYLASAGWMLLLVLWATSLVGVAFALWRARQPNSPARAQYRDAVTAFSVAVAIAIAAPFFVLGRQPAPPRLEISAPIHSPQPAPVTSADPVVALVDGLPAMEGAARRADRVLALVTLAWIAGVAFLTVRLLGGWIAARAICTRAVAFTDPSARRTVDRLSEDLPQRRPVALLQSPHVEAPVVIGWRRPALIVPSDITRQLSDEMIETLLTHELAHIRRGDYPANMVQSLAELLLFFSPAVAWMSRCIREAREYCCDDIAVASCSSPTPYVQALTTLASLSCVNGAPPTMGAAGPRLITRVRRLLQEETMPRFATLRIVVFAGALVVMLIVGARVTTVSAGRAARLAAAGDGQQIQERVPYGYATEQEGSGIELSALVSTLESPADRVTIRNKTDQPVVGVRFVAAVERLSAFRFDPREPVRVFTSELVRTSVPPGGSATVVPHVLTADALQRIADETGDLRLQYFFGVSEVRYGNGFAWTITPNPAATRGSEALGLEQQPQIARELFARDTNVTPTPHGACRDEKGRATSHGGVMAVRGEPGRFGRCQDGRWVERTVR